MLFLGDFYYKQKEKIKIPDFLIKKNKMINLESMINIQLSKKIECDYIPLLSSINILEVFKELNINYIGLANNHITDFNINIEELIELLNKQDIFVNGAGSVKEKFLKFQIEEEQYAILSAGWKVIGCNNKYVNLIDNIKNQIKQFKLENIDTKIIVFLHWNYEYEYYPQPAMRKLSYDLIDLGVELIIGHHPHIIGPKEIYKGKSIYYSLGNFFLSKLDYYQNNLKSSNISSYGLGVEITKNGIIKEYIFNNNNNHIELVNQKIEEITLPNDKDYYLFYQNNKKTNNLLPMYKDFEKLENQLKNIYMYNYHFLLKTYLKINK